jgi:hypothetical protein
MHTATLLHDDVVDESDMRRGKAAARVLWGNEASVLVGDFLLGQAFKMMVEVGSLPCLEVMSSAAAVIAKPTLLSMFVRLPIVAVIVDARYCPLPCRLPIERRPTEPAATNIYGQRQSLHLAETHEFSGWRGWPF